MKKEKNKFLKTIYFVLGILIILFFAKDVVNYTIEQINGILHPIQSKIYFFGKEAKEKTETVLNYKELIDENEKLKNELLEKSLIEEKNKMLLEENDRLREILKMKNRFKLEFKVGKISFQQTRELYESFAINLGSSDGISENMVVLFEDNLLGKIEKSYKNHSIVQMITYQDSLTSARTDNGMLGVIRGNRSETVIFEPISRHEAEIKVGTKIYTSGVSDIYPKDIYIGEVSEIIEKNLGEVEYRVKLAYNVLEVNEVLILTEVNG